MMGGELKIVQVPIDDLKPAEYNPRKANEKEIEGLKASIKEFGLVDPIIVNSAENRKNIIIGGHFRVRVAKDMGIREVPVVYVNIPDIKKEQELNLRLNKNLGQWDYDLLANFDEELLKDVGWESEDLAEMFGLNDIENYEIDFERYNVLMVNPPGGVQLKERVLLKCRNKEEYDLIKKWVLENGDNELVEQILDIVK